MDTNLQNELKFLAKPVGILTIIAILFFVVVSIGLNKLISIKSKIDL